MASYKSELEIGLPYEICIVVRAYMKEKGGISRKWKHKNYKNNEGNWQRSDLLCEQILF